MEVLDAELEQIKNRITLSRHCRHHRPPPLLGGPELKFSSSVTFFPIFGLTAVLKILSFPALALGDNIADLLQLWHQQPVLQIITLANSPACNSGSSAEMLCQSHWKTQIEGLTKRQFVQVSVHRARVCTRSKMRYKCHVSPYFFHALSRQPPPPAPKAKDPSYRTPSPSNHLPLGVELPSSSRDRTHARSFFS